VYEQGLLEPDEPRRFINAPELVVSNLLPPSGGLKATIRGNVLVLSYVASQWYTARMLGKPSRKMRITLILRGFKMQGGGLRRGAPGSKNRGCNELMLPARGSGAGLAAAVAWECQERGVVAACFQFRANGSARLWQIRCE
jgi:hypothetical protein